MKSHPDFDPLSAGIRDWEAFTEKAEKSGSFGKHSYLTTHGKIFCQSSGSLRHTGKSYERTLIFFDSGAEKCVSVRIPLFRCGSCGHFHALLPCLFIIPFMQHSIQFVLSVITDRKENLMKVDDILEKYNLPRTTYYRWMRRYRTCYYIYIRTRDSYSMSLFARAKSDLPGLLEGIFRVCGRTMMEAGRRLHNPPEAHPEQPDPRK